MVSYYRAVGFLPQAVLNGLSRLGWSYDDKTENMSLDFIVRNFSLDRVVKAPAGLDPDKLLSYQGYWMGQLTLEEKIEGCRPLLIQAGLIPQNADVHAPLGQLIQALGERLKLFSDIIQYEEYFVADADLRYDEKAFEKRLLQAPRAGELLKKYREVLASAQTFDSATLEKDFNAFLEKEGLSHGEIIHALRVAVTGKTVGPGMFECLELLGRERCLARIDRVLNRLRQPH
jgi:glutamyl-tRNA synthetase